MNFSLQRRDCHQIRSLLVGIDSNLDRQHLVYCCYARCKLPYLSSSMEDFIATLPALRYHRIDISEYTKTLSGKHNPLCEVYGFMFIKQYPNFQP